MQWICIFLAFLALCRGHGTITLPLSSRAGGNPVDAGLCIGGPCLWFSQFMHIPGEPTLAPEMRTMNVDVDVNAPEDWTRKNPWRAPGSAPVLGSGCGVAGGSDLRYGNGGTPPSGVPQGADAMGVLPPHPSPAVWERGSVVDVANAMFANHGGGWSWRLCPNFVSKSSNRTEIDISEACFQANVLEFVGEHQWIQFGEHERQRMAVPLKKVTTGTTPAGSQWARNPVPACRFCDNYKECGPELPPQQGDNNPWFEQVFCNARCVGFNSHRVPACEGQTQFPEPLAGISGYHELPYSVVDQVLVPIDLEPGMHLLSWRWDCEETAQIWQQCADIRVV